MLPFYHNCPLTPSKLVDTKHLLRYVSMVLSKEEVEKEGLGEVLPVPKGTTTFHSFTNPKKRARETNGDNQYHEPLRNPTKEEIQQCIGIMVSETVKICMSNHYYTIGGQIRVQSTGGAIGSDLTGEVTRVYMLQWDNELRKRCKRASITIDLYRRYVDDMILVMRPISPGWRYEEKRGKLEFNKDWEKEDMEKSESQRTSEVMSTIANSINDNLKVTTDVPENHEDGLMPVLDLKMRVRENEVAPQISWTFFKKPVSSNYTILKRSAVSGSIKRDTIFQEALRRLLHISPDHDWSEHAKHLTIFSNCLRISGYSEKERFETIRGACMRFKEMRRKVDEGEIPSINRKKEEIIAMKIKKGGLTVGSWYLSGEVNKVITCQATPGGILAKHLKKNLNSD